jgi:hypothetical protein
VEFVGWKRGSADKFREIRFRLSHEKKCGNGFP